MKNKKSKCIAIFFLLLPLISLPPVLAQAADSSSKWDQPFDKPMYLLHTTGGKYYDIDWKDSGTITDERWILYPSNNGLIDMPSRSEGLIVRYSIDQQMGPYYTPREVCAVAAAKYPCVIQGSDFILFNCKEGPCANICDKSKHLVWDGYSGCSCICENGWKFDEHGNCVIDTSELEEDLEGGIEVATSQETTVVKPGENVRITGDGERITINAKCREMIRTTTLLYLSQDLFESKSKSASYGYIICLILNACKRLESAESIKSKKTAEFADISTSSSADYLIKLELGLQSGSLRVETVHDEVALDVKTPTMIASSSGKNTFGVAYDPNSGSSVLSAYQNPIYIQPSNGNLAPFILDSGQQVELSSSGIGSIATVGRITEGSTVVSPNVNDIYGPVGEMQGGCYTDPATGQTICVERVSDFSNPNTVSGTVQSGPNISIPNSLQECETYTSEICGTWTRMEDQFNAQWESGASATLDVERWDNGDVVLTRHDTVGSSAGLTARYEGRCTGNHVEGTVTWTWNGSSWSGTWSANW